MPFPRLQGTSRECAGTLATCPGECRLQQHTRSSTPFKKSSSLEWHPIHSPKHQTILIWNGLPEEAKDAKYSPTCSSTTMCIIHWSYLPRRLQQHFPNPQTQPLRKTRAGVYGTSMLFKHVPHVSSQPILHPPPGFQWTISGTPYSGYGQSLLENNALSMTFVSLLGFRVEMSGDHQQCLSCKRKL